MIQNRRPAPPASHARQRRLRPVWSDRPRWRITRRIGEWIARRWDGLADIRIPGTVSARRAAHWFGRYFGRRWFNYLFPIVVVLASYYCIHWSGLPGSRALWHWQSTLIAAAAAAIFLLLTIVIYSRITPYWDLRHICRYRNAAVATALAADLIAVGLIMREAILPLLYFFRRGDLVPAFPQGLGRGGAVLLCFGVYFSSLYVLLLARVMLGLLTLRTKEIKALVTGNVPVAILYGALSVALALFLAQPVADIMRSALVP